MDKVSDFESEDCAFESRRCRLYFVLSLRIHVYTLTTKPVCLSFLAYNHWLHSVLDYYCMEDSADLILILRIEARYTIYIINQPRFSSEGHYWTKSTQNSLKMLFLSFFVSIYTEGL